MSGPLRRLRHFLRRGERLRVLEEEMRTHLELAYEEHRRGGLPPAEARRRAHLEFGNVLATREESADAMTGALLQSWVQDGRIAARGLARRPWFALSLVAILALGLGVTTAIFSVVRGVLWRPLPVPRPGELHLVVNPEDRPMLLSAPTLRRLEADAAARGRVIAHSDSTRVALRRGDAPAEPASVQFVNGGFFSALGLGAVHGRLLLAADDEPDRPRAVAVAAWRWWRNELGGDPAAVGRSFRLNGVEVTIVGVAPESFTGLAIGNGVDLWLPAGLHAPLRCAPSSWAVSRDDPPTLGQWMRDDRVSWLNAMVRVPPGATTVPGALEAAWRPHLATITEIFDDPAERERAARRVPRLAPSPRGFSEMRTGFRQVGTLLSLLVGAVVLVTAANASTLLLLRMLGRTRELGVRLALGAGRARLVRAALTEGLLLSAAGAAAGLVLGLALTPVLADWVVPGAVDALPGVDGTLLAALAGLVLVLGLVLGGAPAWLSAHLSPQAVLQQRGALGGSLRWGRALIVVQLGLSVLLLAAAGTLALDVRRVLGRDLGFARQGVITTFFNLPAAGFDAGQAPAVMARLRQAAESLGPVRAVGFAASGALSGSRSASGTYFRGDDARPVDDNVQHESVDEGYFSALGMTLLRGRGFTAGDGAGKPRVAVISDRLARQVFGSADPVGRRFGFDREPEPAGDWEIVGVVADARVNGVRGEPAAMYYTPLAQWSALPGCLVVRLDGDAAAVRETLQKTVAAAEPALMFSRWLTIEERARQWLRNDLATVRLTFGFGLLATLLAVIGVLGALGYLVATRSREIAVRLALGAEPGRVGRAIVREAALLGAAGAALGLLLALLVPRLAGATVRVDGLALAAAVLIGLAAAIAGGLRPARRASRVDPLELLRSE